MFFEKLQWKLLRRVAAGDLNKRTSGHQCLGLAVARRLASESQSNNNGVTRGCTLLPCCAVFCFNPGDCRGINHEATAQSQHPQWADEHKAGATTGPEPRIRPTSESRGSCTWVCATRLANGSHPVNSIQAERIIGYRHALYRRTTGRGMFGATNECIESVLNNGRKYCCSARPTAHKISENSSLNNDIIVPSAEYGGTDPLLGKRGAVCDNVGSCLSCLSQTRSVANRPDVSAWLLDSLPWRLHFPSCG